MSVYRYGLLSIRDGGDYATVKVRDVRDGVPVHTQDVPPEHRRKAAQELAGDEWQVVPKAGATPPLYLLDDLWQALGGDPADFDDWHTRHGAAGTWGQLLAIVRRTFRPVCGKPVDEEYCVLTAPRSESDAHVCHGPSDVGIDELPPIPVAQPDRPEPVDPASVAKVKAEALREAADAYWDDISKSLRASVTQWLHERADEMEKPEPDPAAVEALADVLVDVGITDGLHAPGYARELISSHNVRVVSTDG